MVNKICHQAIINGHQICIESDLELFIDKIRDAIQKANEIGILIKIEIRSYDSLDY